MDSRSNVLERDKQMSQNRKKYSYGKAPPADLTVLALLTGLIFNLRIAVPRREPQDQPKAIRIKS